MYADKTRTGVHTALNIDQPHTVVNAYQVHTAGMYSVTSWVNPILDVFDGGRYARGQHTVVQ